MTVDPIEKKQAGMSRRLSREIGNTLDRVRNGNPSGYRGKPDAMAYFYEKVDSLKEGMGFQSKAPAIGVLCTQVPAELILAVGRVPQRLCSGVYAYEQAGSDLLHPRCCPVVKATTGFLSMNRSYKNLFDMIVVPATCDQKVKAAEIWRSMGYPVVVMEVPSGRDSEEAREYWYRSVKNFAVELQRTTGEKITGKKLASAIRILQKAASAYRKFQDVMTDSQSRVAGSDALLVTHSLFLDDPASWSQAVDRLTRELELVKDENVFSEDSKKPRIFMTGSPSIFPNLKTALLIEEAGGRVIADDFCTSGRMLYDAVYYDEGNLYDMIPAIADRYLKPSTCTVFTPGDDHRRNLIRMAKRSSADGVIYQTFVGCHPFEMEQAIATKMLDDEKIPVLTLETDYSPEDRGQLMTRIEAFIESIHARKMRYGKP